MDTMAYKQINVSLSDNLRVKAQAYAKKYGFRNIQELITETLREKVFPSEYDESYTPEQVALFEKLLKTSIERGDIVSEKEIMKVLKS